MNTNLSLYSEKDRFLYLLKVFRKNIKNFYRQDHFMYFYEKLKSKFYNHQQNRQEEFYEYINIFSTIKTFPNQIIKNRQFRIFSELCEMARNNEQFCKTSTSFFIYKNVLLLIRLKYFKLLKLIRQYDDKVKTRVFYTNDTPDFKEIDKNSSIIKNFKRQYENFRRNANFILNSHFRLLKKIEKFPGEDAPKIDDNIMNYIFFFYKKFLTINRIIDECFLNENISKEKFSHFMKEIYQCFISGF